MTGYGLIKTPMNASLGRWLRALPIAAMVLLGACSTQPRVPDWQLNAKAASDRFVAAELTGNVRVAALELGRARQALSATGRADWLARLELLACAVRQASLDFSACTAFEALRSQAALSETAYADYLAGQLDPAWLELLPAPQRPLARFLAGGSGPADPKKASGLAGVSALEAMDEPLSRLLAAAVLVRAGQGGPAVLQDAVNTASDQGWRKPLLAWLGLAAQRAEQAGHTQEALRLRARMALVAPQGAAAPAQRLQATPGVRTP